MENVRSEKRPHFGLMFGMILMATAIVGCFGIMLTKYMNANLAKNKAHNVQTSTKKVDVSLPDGSMDTACPRSVSHYCNDTDTQIFIASLRRLGYTFDPDSGRLTKSTGPSSLTSAHRKLMK